MEEIDQLRAAWCFACASKFFVLCEFVDSAGLAGIGAPGKSNFGAFLRRALLDAGCAYQKLGSVEVDFHIEMSVAFKSVMLPNSVYDVLVLLLLRA